MKISTPINNITSIEDLTEDELRVLVPEIAQEISIVFHKYCNAAILGERTVWLNFCIKKLLRIRL